MKEISVHPFLANTEAVAEFVEQTLTEEGCPMAIIFKMNMAADELFSNIAHYSEASDATVHAGVVDGSAVLIFEDNGIEYDPTKQREPDVTSSLEEREIGGLGIFLVQKTMDEIRYSYTDGKNNLYIRKKIS